MEKLVRRIRKQLAAARRRSTGRPRYPRQLKAEVVVAAAGLHDAGYSHQAASRELDLNPVTLMNWIRKAASYGAEDDASMVEVSVVAEGEALTQETPELVVHGPLGTRVKGLDVAAVAELLRRLA